LKESEAERLLAEKRAALGLLVAGFAHEANNPLGALSSSIRTFQRAFGRLQNLLEAEENQSSGARLQEVQKLRPALSENLRVSQDACERLHSMLESMKSFVNLDQSDFRRVDIHNCFESTLELLRHQMKGGIRVLKHYGEIPEIDCFPSSLNQVFMHVFLNYIEAISSLGDIHIQSWHENGMVFVRILDTGRGIPPENLKKIFDPGFTTKGRGVGTGMGLPICQSVVAKYGGKIQVESELGKGTSLTLQLPVRLESATVRSN